VNGLEFLKDPECYVCGSIATGRASLAGQDEGERSDEERYPGPPGCGLRRRTSTPTLAKLFLSLNPHTKALEPDCTSTETTSAIEKDYWNGYLERSRK